MYTLDATDSYEITKPKGTYIYEIIEVADGIVSISSDNSLRLIDPRSLSTEPLYTLPKLHTEITSLKALDADSSIVCTAGRDGKVRITDLRQRSRIAELSSSKFPRTCWNFKVACIGGEFCKDHHQFVRV